MLSAQSRALVLIVPRYFTSVFVSLGVFLFGYDQGVMSGIITYFYELLKDLERD